VGYIMINYLRITATAVY